MISQLKIWELVPGKFFTNQEGPFFQIQNGLHYHLPYLRDAQKWVFEGPTQYGYWVKKTEPKALPILAKEQILQNQL